MDEYIYNMLDFVSFAKMNNKKIFNANQFSIFYTLKTHARKAKNGKYECFVSRKTIMSKLNLKDQKSYKKNIQKLKKYNLIKNKTNYNNRENLYFEFVYHDIINNFSIKALKNYVDIEYIMYEHRSFNNLRKQIEKERERCLDDKRVEECNHNQSKKSYTKQEEALVALRDKIPEKYIDFAKRFYDYQKNKHKNKVNNTEKNVLHGANILYKLYKIDGYHFENQIKPAIYFGAQDKFWCTKLLSLNGLRQVKDNGNTKFINLLIALEAQYGDTSKYNAEDDIADAEDDDYESNIIEFSKNDV